MIFKVRRAYRTPAVYLLGGGVPEGLDTTGGPKPAERAERMDNLWREADGCICKRPGIVVAQRCDIAGRVEWMKEFHGYRYYFYVGATGGVLRREKRGMVEERPAQNAKCLEMGQRLYIFSKGEWIEISDEQTLLITSEGRADLNIDFCAAVRAWDVDRDHDLSPLIRAGGRPQKRGQGVLPPNLLVPLVTESFVYTQSDKEAKRNRFNLSFAPQVRGQLPTNADGTHADLSDADNAIRTATMNASARLEVRREKTDAYGNTVSFWSVLNWLPVDNIDADDMAFWVQNIHAINLSFDGDDNVRITYFRPSTEETAKLYDADVFALFGVDGQKDRIFAASGQRIYYSGMDEIFYFGALQYLDFGEEILMMGSEGDVLSVFSANGVWRISGHAESRAGEYVLDAYFAVSARFPSPHPYGECIVAGNELLFYSERGVCAVAPSGVMDERNVQLRSERLRGILQEEDPSAIRMGTWQDKLFLAGEKGVYLLDLSRRAKSNEPYSSHCYEAYFWSITGVECFVAGDDLRFFKDGQLYTLKEGAYYDELSVDGELRQVPVAAVWESPVLGDKMQCGTFCGLIFSVGGPTAMRISVWDERGGWRELYDYDGSLFPFCYAPMRYGLFNYGSRRRFTLRRRLLLRHRRALRLRFENDIGDSPLRLQSFALEYK